MSLNRLYICQTCVRDKALAHGEHSRGRQLSDSVKQILQTHHLGRQDRFVLRQVNCLSGCLNPCNIALRGQGKYNLRFSRLTPEDAPAVIDLAALYIDHPLGDVAEAHWPEALKGKLTARTPPPHLLIKEAAMASVSQVPTSR